MSSNTWTEENILLLHPLTSKKKKVLRLLYNNDVKKVVPFLLSLPSSSRNLDLGEKDYIFFKELQNLKKIFFKQQNRVVNFFIYFFPQKIVLDFVCS